MERAIYFMPAGGLTPNTTYTYTVTITNTDSEPNYLKSIWDTLPDGFTYVAGSSSGITGSDPQVTGGGLRWNLGPDFVYFDHRGHVAAGVTCQQCHGPVETMAEVTQVSSLKMGWCILSGALTLAIMVLPTIIRTSEEAIKAVPASYREVSCSLGATRWETVLKVVLPNALPGIVTGVMLSIGRCIGETAAVIFTAGASLRLPHSVFDSTRTMAVHFYILAREGISNENAYGTAAVLIISVLLVNSLSYWMMNRFIARRTK